MPIYSADTPPAFLGMDDWRDIVDRVRGTTPVERTTRRANADRAHQHNASQAEVIATLHLAEAPPPAGGSRSTLEDLQVSARGTQLAEAIDKLAVSRIAGEARTQASRVTLDLITNIERARPSSFGESHGKVALHDAFQEAGIGKELLRNPAMEDKQATVQEIIEQQFLPAISNAASFELAWRRLAPGPDGGLRGGIAIIRAKDQAGQLIMSAAEVTKTSGGWSVVSRDNDLSLRQATSTELRAERTTPRLRVTEDNAQNRSLFAEAAQLSGSPLSLILQSGETQSWVRFEPSGESVAADLSLGGQRNTPAALPAGAETARIELSPTGQLQPARARTINVVEYRETRTETPVESLLELEHRGLEVRPNSQFEVRVREATIKGKRGLTTELVEEGIDEGANKKRSLGPVGLGRDGGSITAEALRIAAIKDVSTYESERLGPHLVIRWDDRLMPEDRPRPPQGVSLSSIELERRAGEALWMQLRAKLTAADETSREILSDLQTRSQRMRDTHDTRWTLIAATEEEARVLRGAMDWAGNLPKDRQDARAFWQETQQALQTGGPIAIKTIETLRQENGLPEPENALGRTKTAIRQWAATLPTNHVPSREIIGRTFANFEPPQPSALPDPGEVTAAFTKLRPAPTADLPRIDGLILPDIKKNAADAQEALEAPYALAEALGGLAASRALTNVITKIQLSDYDSLKAQVSTTQTVMDQLREISDGRERQGPIKAKFETLIDPLARAVSAAPSGRLHLQFADGSEEVLDITRSDKPLDIPKVATNRNEEALIRAAPEAFSVANSGAANASNAINPAQAEKALLHAFDLLDIKKLADGRINDNDRVRDSIAQAAIPEISKNGPFLARWDARIDPQQDNLKGAESGRLTLDFINGQSLSLDISRIAPAEVDGKLQDRFIVQPAGSKNPIKGSFAKDALNAAITRLNLDTLSERAVDKDPTNTIRLQLANGLTSAIEEHGTFAAAWRQNGQGGDLVLTFADGHQAGQKVESLGREGGFGVRSLTEQEIQSALSTSDLVATHRTKTLPVREATDAPENHGQMLVPAGRSAVALADMMRDQAPWLARLTKIATNGQDPAEFDRKVTEKVINQAHRIFVYADRISTSVARAIGDSTRAGTLAMVMTTSGEERDKDSEVRRALSETMSARKYASSMEKASTARISDSINDIPIASPRGRLLLSVIGIPPQDVERFTNSEQFALRTGSILESGTIPGTLGQLREQSKMAETRAAIAAQEAKVRAQSSLVDYGTGSENDNRSIQRILNKIFEKYENQQVDAKEARLSAQRDVAEWARYKDFSSAEQDRILENVAGAMQGFEKNGGSAFSAYESDALDASDRPDKSNRAILAEDKNWVKAIGTVQRIERDCEEFGLARMSPLDSSRLEELREKNLAAQQIGLSKLTAIDPNAVSEFKRLETIERHAPGVLIPEHAEKMKELQKKIEELGANGVPDGSRLSAAEADELQRLEQKLHDRKVHVISNEGFPATATPYGVLFMAGDIGLLEAERKTALLLDPTDGMNPAARRQATEAAFEAAKAIDATASIRIRPNTGIGGISAEREILVLDRGHTVALGGKDRFETQAVLVAGGTVISAAPPWAAKVGKDEKAYNAVVELGNLVGQGGDSQARKADPQAIEEAKRKIASTTIAPAEADRVIADWSQRSSPRINAFEIVQDVTVPSPRLRNAAVALAATMAQAVVVAGAQENSAVLSAATEARIDGKRVFVASRAARSTANELAGSRALLKPAQDAISTRLDGSNFGPSRRRSEALNSRLAELRHRAVAEPLGTGENLAITLDTNRQSRNFEKPWNTMSSPAENLKGKSSGTKASANPSPMTVSATKAQR